MESTDHAIAVLLADKSGGAIYFEMRLVNKIRFCLNKNDGLFLDMASTQTLLRDIGNGFLDAEGAFNSRFRDYDLTKYAEDFYAESEPYFAFRRQVEKMPADVRQTVILMTNDDIWAHGGSENGADRLYRWAKFTSDGSRAYGECEAWDMGAETVPSPETILRSLLDETESK